MHSAAREPFLPFDAVDALRARFHIFASSRLRMERPAFTSLRVRAERRILASRQTKTWKMRRRWQLTPGHAASRPVDKFADMFPNVFAGPALPIRNRGVNFVTRQPASQTSAEVSTKEFSRSKSMISWYIVPCRHNPTQYRKVNRINMQFQAQRKHKLGQRVHENKLRKNCL